MLGLEPAQLLRAFICLAGLGLTAWFLRGQIIWQTMGVLVLAAETVFLFLPDKQQPWMHAATILLLGIAALRSGSVSRV